MRNYTITCVSGTVVLLRGSSEAAVELEWDDLVESGDAEDRVAGTTEPASRADVSSCVAMGHDYR